MKYLIFFTCIIAVFSCQKKQEDREITPWGTVVGDNLAEQEDTTSKIVSLSDIVAQGEIIMLTINGPETYYDYHGHGMGLQYLLCDKFAQSIGVKLRVDVCKDSIELNNKIQKGEGDIIAYSINNLEYKKCSDHWYVHKNNTELFDEIKRWYKPEYIKEIDKLQKELIASGGVIRHVYAPMISKKKGLISRWDNLFQKYAPTARVDWRLLAAQCYQESCFDPKARSWAGACGLMQIMPSTAKHLGLPVENIYSPEQNISAAARYMAELQNGFHDIPGQYDRLCFTLASYNGGMSHIRDAMALAKKYGKNPTRWTDVKTYVLKLMDPLYYRDPVVKSGYMRGTETANYVDKIFNRWRDYGGNINRLGYTPVNGYTGPSTQPVISGNSQPRPAKKKNKYL